MAKDNKKSTEPIVIKKYANRRLYNTAVGSFVTLADLYELVKQEIAFIVEDAKTGKDLTASVLAQIVAEEENKGNNLFSPDYLRQILKLYGNGTPPELASYLEQSIAYFSENQEQMTQQFNDMFDGSTSMEKWAEIGQQNMALFQNSMTAFTPPGPDENPAANPAANSAGSTASKAGAESKVGGNEKEIEKLQREMAEMQARLNGLSKDT